MKILFVRPQPAPETIGLQHIMIVEPLELEVMAALVGPDDEPVIDFRVVRNATRLFPVLLQHLKYDTPLPAGVLCAGQVLKQEALPGFDFYFPLPRRDLTLRYGSRVAAHTGPEVPIPKRFGVLCQIAFLQTLVRLSPVLCYRASVISTRAH